MMEYINIKGGKLIGSHVSCFRILDPHVCAYGNVGLINYDGSNFLCPNCRIRGIELSESFRKILHVNFRNLHGILFCRLLLLRFLYDAAWRRRARFSLFLFTLGIHKENLAGTKPWQRQAIWRITRIHKKKLALVASFFSFVLTSILWILKYLTPGALSLLLEQEP